MSEKTRYSDAELEECFDTKGYLSNISIVFERFQ